VRGAGEVYEQRAELIQSMHPAMPLIDAWIAFASTGNLSGRRYFTHLIVPVFEPQVVSAASGSRFLKVGPVNAQILEGGLAHGAVLGVLCAAEVGSSRAELRLFTSDTASFESHLGERMLKLPADVHALKLAPLVEPAEAADI